MTAYLAAVAALTAIAALLIFRVTRQGAGARRAHRRPCAPVIVALDLWDWARSGAALLPPAPYAPGPIVTDAEVREEWERLADERGTPALDEPAGEWADAERWARLPGLPESHPYPLPTMYPRTAGDGLIVATPDGCEVVRRAAASRAVRNPTLLDLPVVAGFRRDGELDGIEWEHQPDAELLGRVLDGLRALDVTS